MTKKGDTPQPVTTVNLCYNGSHKSDAEALAAAYLPTPESALRTYTIEGQYGDTKIVGIVPQHLIDRLNDLFGATGWTFEVLQLWTCENSEAVVRGCLWTAWPSGAVSRREQFGSSKNERGDIGDALKGAVTNCLGKCATGIGVGSDVYRGERDDALTDGEPAAVADLVDKTQPEDQGELL
jgi:hypothetical protein